MHRTTRTTSIREFNQNASKALNSAREQVDIVPIRRGRGGDIIAYVVPAEMMLDHEAIDRARRLETQTLSEEDIVAMRGGYEGRLALSLDELRALAEQHPEWWDDPSGPITVEPLGRGESFTAHLLRRGEGELVLREPHKALGELPQSLAEEHAVLARVPKGLTSRPVAVHEPSARDPRAYLVTTRVPGSVLPAARWADDSLLATLATQLARLHHGGGTAGLAVPGRIDPVGGAEAARAWWREHEPVSAAVIEPLWPGVQRHQEAAAPAFEDIDLVLLHGDPAAANLLVDEAGTVRFVDWEWAQVGDPARDLAFIGGPIAAEPWYADLTNVQVRDQAEVYLAERERLAASSGRDDSAAGKDRLEMLLTRRTAHLLQEAYFTAAHLHRVAAAGGAGAERAARTHTALLDQVSALVS